MNKSQKAFSLIELSIVILIIGILIAGITQSSRLVAQMRLSTARSLTQNSPISSIQNLTLWVEATSAASLSTYNSTTSAYTVVDQPDDQTSIGAWNDINPQIIVQYRNTATQTIATSQPKYIANAINGLPALQFDGTDDALLSPLNTSGDVYSAFVVISSGATFVGDKSIFGPSAAKGISWNVKADGSTMGVAKSTISYLGTASTPLSTNTKYILHFRWSDASNTIYFRINGADAGSSTANQQFSDSTTTLKIGSESTSGMNWNGLIAELVTFDRVLKAEEITSIEKYLGQKWGIKTP